MDPIWSGVGSIPDATVLNLDGGSENAEDVDTKIIVATKFGIRCSTEAL